ncbi:sulfatase-like hydrolase/transferase [Microbacterium sp. NPDC077184]|uniref:sulfatase-like hydrolase/transferase n=1 Tax=Microbacterium sp. NPDC077184 TaxID=3154764 RepID=UPI00342E4570
MTDRPNIVWIMSEDFPPLTTAYGDPLAATPHLDALARDGVVFEAASCTSPVCAPSRFSVITGVYPWAAGPAQNMEAHAITAELPAFSQLLRDAGYYCTNNEKTHYNSDIEPDAVWDESSPEAHWRNRPPGTPFFAAFMPQATHESALFHQPVTAVSPADVRVPAYLPDVPDVRADLARYYTAAAQLDAQVGVILSELEEDGLAEDTIVLWTSDHGGVAARSKRFCYEAGLRIPLVAKVPERWSHLSRWAPGTHVETPVGQIDLTPAVLAIAGAEVPAHMQGTALLGADAPEPPGVTFGGRDRMDERYDMMRSARRGRYRYIRNYDPDLPWGQHYSFAWLAANWRAFEAEHIAGRLDPRQEAFWGEKPAEELYDVVADIDQVRNLADDPAHAGVLGELRALVDAHQLDVVDNGFIPEGVDREGWSASRQPGAYPLERIMKLAWDGIQRDPANLPLFVAALDDEDEIVRFHAARGLRMLRDAAAPALPHLRSAYTDASAAVRVAAAEAASCAGASDAVSVLVAHLDAAQPSSVQLRALNALTLTAPTGQPEVAAAVAALHDDDDHYVRGAARYLAHLLAGDYRPDTPGIFDRARFRAARAAKAPGASGATGAPGAPSPGGREKAGTA